MEATPDEPTAPPTADKPKGFVLSKEMAVAGAAILVSVITLFVYIYQAQIMMSQQHASVCPYIEWTSTYISDVDQEFYISVVNKGVGPALVKDAKLTLDGKLYPYNDYGKFMSELCGGDAKRDSLWIIYSLVDNRVMAPGEEIRIIHAKSWQGSRLPKIDHQRYKYTICYCSIYEDCWKTDGTISKEGRCE